MAPSVVGCTSCAGFLGNRHGHDYGGRLRAVCVVPSTKSAPRHATDTFRSCAIYLVCCCPIGVIYVRVDRDVHVDEVVVQRLPRSDIGAIWHVPIIPVVDVLHGFALMWGIKLVPGSIKVDLDKFGQIGPADRRACILH